MTILCAFTGVLTADANKRTSKAGKDWASLNVRVGHGEQTQWASVAVFGDDAAGVADLKAGSAVFVEGRIELRKWKNHAGHDMAGLNVGASLCRPIDLKQKPQTGRERAGQSAYAPPPDDRLDF
jgi:single-stranded DNA-binding protein